jgi:gas vesicle protein
MGKMRNQDMETLEERVKEAQQSNTKDFLLGALIGGVVGAATALFLAPKSGKEIRNTLNELKDVTISKGSELVSVAKDSKAMFTNTTNQVKQIVNKEKDFSEKEEHTTEIKYVPIEPYQSSHEELQRKLEEAQKAIEAEERKLKG